jgi:hypothetical protein
LTDLFLFIVRILSLLNTGTAVQRVHTAIHKSNSQYVQHAGNIFVTRDGTAQVAAEELTNVLAAVAVEAALTVTVSAQKAAKVFTLASVRLFYFMAHIESALAAEDQLRQARTVAAVIAVKARTCANTTKSSTERSKMTRSIIK